MLKSICERCKLKSKNIRNHHVNASVRDKWNNKSGRTIALCSTCHGRIHALINQSMLIHMSTEHPQFFEELTQKFMEDKQAIKECREWILRMNYITQKVDEEMAAWKKEHPEEVCQEA